MSQRVGSPYQNASQASAARGRAQSHGAAAGYTLTHAGRQVRVGPVVFWIVVGTFVIMGAWSIMTATYFAFRDSVLARLISHQTEMQFAYEDRIADMRAQVDRVTSRQLLDQEQFEQKLDQILRRQAALESRASALNGLADPTPTGSIKPAVRGIPQAQPADGKPSPINDTIIAAPPPDRSALLNLRMPRRDASRKPIGVADTLAHLEASLDRVELRQDSSLGRIEEGYDSKVRRITGVLGELGVDASHATTSATGGPFVPVKLPAQADGFERRLMRINFARAQADRLTQTLVSVPVRKPVEGELDQSSGFGVRVDPFNHAPAMHTGIDFRGDTGDAVHATAAGTVTVAGWSGGYGRMVEIDHGNGLATRYGHLSEINVAVGQHIRIGQTVGRLGSTGRSTGPHLHYETRVDGEAVNPEKFLHAGEKLGGLL
jgi:murein DD-endopeptidase MepM/ murein hydrolase activator NlpD